MRADPPARCWRAKLSIDNMCDHYCDPRQDSHGDLVAGSFEWVIKAVGIARPDQPGHVSLMAHRPQLTWSHGGWCRVSDPVPPEDVETAEIGTGVRVESYPLASGREEHKHLSERIERVQDMDARTRIVDDG